MEKVKKLCQSHLESCQLLVKSYPKGIDSFSKFSRDLAISVERVCSNDCAILGLFAVELLQKALHSAESAVEQISR